MQLEERLVLLRKLYARARDAGDKEEMERIEKRANFWKRVIIARDKWKATVVQELEANKQIEFAATLFSTDSPGTKSP